MNLLLITGLITCVIAILLFVNDRRRFSIGLVLMAGIMQLTLWILQHFGYSSTFTSLVDKIIISIPFLIILIAFYLIFNGKTMRHKEGKRLANQLSLFLGFYILFIIFLTIILISLVFFTNSPNIIIVIALTIVILISTYLGILAITYLLYSYIYQMAPIKKNIDYIIILGSGLIGDKVPPLLKSRLDKGIEVYYQQKKKGINPKLIVSGGQGQDELISEAEAMKKYLISQEIPKIDILTENKSTTTYENMKFSKSIMDSLSKKYTSIFITNNYHVFRAAIYARKAKLKAEGKGAPTAFYFLPSALIREFIAILVLLKWTHLIILLLLSAPIILAIIL